MSFLFFFGGNKIPAQDTKTVWAERVRSRQTPKTLWGWKDRVLLITQKKKHFFLPSDMNAKKRDRTCDGIGRRDSDSTTPTSHSNKQQFPYQLCKQMSLFSSLLLAVKDFFLSSSFFFLFFRTTMMARRELVDKMQNNAQEQCTVVLCWLRKEWRQRFTHTWLPQPPDSINNNLSSVCVCTVQWMKLQRLKNPSKLQCDSRRGGWKTASTSNESHMAKWILRDNIFFTQPIKASGWAYCVFCLAFSSPFRSTFYRFFFGVSW